MERKIKTDIPGCADVVTRTTAHFVAVSEILSVLVFLGGCAVLLGWVLDIRIFKSIFPDCVAMKANAALCFVLSGFSLWLLQFKRQSIPRFRVMAIVCSLGVLGIGLATAWEYISGMDLGIDQCLFREAPGAMLTSSPGRMAVTTAVNFTLAGLALFLLVSKTKHRCFFSQGLILPVGIISVLAVVGHFYEAPPLFLGPDLSTAMALHTMALFIALFLGILFCRPGCGVMTLVSSDAIGGKLIRRLFPVVFLILVILGSLKLWGEKAGVISHELGISFVVVGNLALMLLYIYVLSFWLNKADSERKRAEDDLKKQAQELETQSWGLQKANDGIRALYQELEKKNVDLEKANCLKDDFVSIVAHELRNPLGIVWEATSLILDGLAGPVAEQQRSYIEMVRKTAERLIHITNDLLDFAKIEAGKIVLNFEKIDLLSVVRQSCEGIVLRAQKKGITISEDLPVEKLEIQGDFNKLSQVMINLLSNALKFIEKGSITAEVQDRGEEVYCAVKDTGPGISPENISRLFIKFEQFGKPAVPSEKGSGLGLVISKSIVEAHSGRMGVESEFGKGSTFFFILPKRQR